MRVYPLRTSSNSWIISIYSNHLCTDKCKYNYIIEHITDDSTIMFVFDNPDYNVTNERCQYYNTLNKSSVNLSEFNNTQAFCIDGKMAYENQIVIPDQRITVDLSFPLKDSKKIVVKSVNPLGFTLTDIIFTLKKMYEWIYKKEEETCTETYHTIMMLCSCNEYDRKDRVISRCDEVEIKNSEHICAICLESIENGIKTVCNHSYHKECFLKWMEQKETCPTCRKHLFLCDECKGSNIIYTVYKGKVIPKEMRGLIGNRNTTDGMFGIHSYDMDELFLRDMTYNSVTKTLYPNIIVSEYL